MIVRRLPCAINFRLLLPSDAHYAIFPVIYTKQRQNRKMECCLYGGWIVCRTEIIFIQITRRIEETSNQVLWTGHNGREQMKRMGK